MELVGCLAWVRWHWIVRHDGPVSFRRAFRKEDWVRLLAAAEIPREAVTVETLAAGTVVRGAVEVRSVILKRLVRLRDMKPLAPVALMAHLITSNHLRNE